MKSKLFCLLTLACFAVSAVEVDIFREDGDPRVAEFTIPGTDGADAVKNFVMERDGKKYYPQTSKISNYPSGSVRWYRLISDAPAGRYKVSPRRPGKNLYPNVVVPIKKNKSYTNKLLTLTFDAKPFAVKVTGKDDVYTIQAPEITLPDGSRPQAVFKKVKAVETGIVQTVLVFQGEYAPVPEGEKRYWQLRITMWNNKDFIKVEPLLGTALTKAVNTPFEEMRSLKSARMRIICGSAAGAVKSKFTQWEDNSYDVTADGKTQSQKGSLGLFNLANKASLAIPEMAERFPIGVTTLENALDVDLFPAIQPADRYANGKPIYIKYFPIYTGNYVMRAGVEISFPMYLALNKKIDAAKLLAPIPVGMVDVEDLNKSGAWLHYIGKPDKYSKPFEPEIKNGLEAYFTWRDRERWYGFMNFGDSHGERTWNWMNHEYDTAAIFFEHALRLRNPKYFREALRCARHQMEVDMVKNHPDPKNNGGVYKHALGHTGGYFTGDDVAKYIKGCDWKGVKNPFLNGDLSSGHTRIRGMCMAYVLTGDQRYRETACLTGNWIRQCKLFALRAWPGGSAREPGWGLVNLTSIYWMDANPRFLKAAEELGWIVLSHAQGRGVHMRKLRAHQCPPPPGGWNEKNSFYKFGSVSFPTGYQAMGMYLLYKQTRDKFLKEDLFDNLKATAEYIKARLYLPEYRAFIHSPVPWRRQSLRNGAGAGTSLRNVLLMDALLNNNQESQAIAVDTLQQMLTRREVFDSPLKGANPDDPHPKSASAGLYFIPVTIDFMRQLDIVMPPITYDTSKQELWNGSETQKREQEK
ncbi:MAG: hypothetical protein E7052_05070 [Lentisphaerae bacterium]|nr:hypothetical protein [Lentisphaerota bacterium]